MRKLFAWTALTALVVSVAGIGFNGISPALGAVLDGFSIDTQDKSVTITLFTDQRVPYTTETEGRQFTIIVPDAKLSPEQAESLPVVIDNKNRFIGRAVPTDDGKVKIILPNLPANEYAVSIQQKLHGHQTTTAQTKPTPAEKTATATPTAKPRMTAFESDEQALERIAQKFQARKTAHKPAQSTTSRGLRLSPVKNAQSVDSTIWNPYVVGNRPTTEKDAKSQSEQTSGTKSPPSEHTTAELFPKAAVTDNRFPAVQPHDPLWYLHSLPPAIPPVADNLEGLAKALTPDDKSSDSISPQVEEKIKIISAPHPLHGLKTAILSLPKWLLASVGVFFCGLGLFGLIGAVVLLRILFVQTQPSLIQPAFVMPGAAMPYPQASTVSTGAVSSASKSAYATMPFVPLFQDVSSINTLDYLKGGARTVPQAVRNTTLLKFPRMRRYGQKSSRTKVTTLAGR
jgi:hypothetical protein